MSYFLPFIGCINSVVVDPSSIFGASLQAWYRGDAVTLATGVSSWTDKTGNGNHLIQATGTKQPAYTSSDSTLNNRGTLLGDGANTYLNNVSMVIPATCFIWYVIKQNAWTLAYKFFDSPGGFSIIQTTGTPSLVPRASSQPPDNTGAPIGSWKRGYARLDNTTSDAAALGSVVTTGVAVGKTNTNNTSVFAPWPGTNSNWSGACAEIAIVNRLPTGPELSAIDAYGSSYYLGSILT